MEFEEFWNLLAKELKNPTKFKTTTGIIYFAVFEGNRIKFTFNDKEPRVEYKESFKACFELYFRRAKRNQYTSVSHNASYVIPILHAYL